MAREQASALAPPRVSVSGDSCDDSDRDCEVQRAMAALKGLRRESSRIKGLLNRLASTPPHSMGLRVSCILRRRLTIGRARIGGPVLS